MNAGETMVICENCEHENEPDQRFCDECGAELHPASSTLEQLKPSQALGFDTKLETPAGQTITIGTNLSLGRLSRYTCTFDEGPALLVEEAASAPGFLASRIEAMKGLEGLLGIWVPQTVFTHHELHYAVGPLPDFPTLADRVRQVGPLSSDEVRLLALALGALLTEVHARSYLVRSFHPGRIWWDGSSSIVIDNLDRMIVASLAGEDFQVVNGFSPPEAYGVGSSTIGVTGDLFSLGAILHFAISGARTDLESRENFFTFAPLTGINDPVLQQTIELATAKNAIDRPQTVQEFLELLALEKLPDPIKAPAPPSPPGESPPPQSSQSVCQFQVALRSHVGCVRQINQDACLEMRFSAIEKSIRQNTHLVVMIDGMGGEAEGDKAASLALRTIAQELVGSSLTLKDQRATSPLLPIGSKERNLLLLERALKKANRIIFEYAERRIERQGMGCTITACILEPTEIALGHVGDTRGYLWRDGQLKKLTTDHSLVGRLVEMGQLTEEEARNSPQRSIIYRAMGTNPDVEVDLYHENVQPGDRIILSSDGVWEYFVHEELQEIVTEHQDPDAIADHLIKVCLSRGADDNATVAVIFANRL